MPRKFDTDEKTLIQNKLLEAGRKLFSQFGFKKTNVGELTEAAGIAAGTFYTFYRSKEELFYELMEEEEQHIQQVLLTRLQSAPMNKETFRSFLHDGFRLMTESPMLRQVLLPDQLAAILRKLPQDRLDSNYAQDQLMLLPLIRRWQADGVLRMDAEPEMIVSMIRSLLLLSLHKKEIGETVYEATLELLITAVADGLFTGNGV